MDRSDASRSHIHWGGRIITGPDRLYFYFALVAYAIPVGLYLARVCPLLEKYMSVSPYVVVSYLFAISLIFFFIASFADPGIIPRGVPPDIDPSASPFSIEEKHPSAKKVRIGNREFESKWCDTCNIYRPLRSTHCAVCNNCVEKFDHHCPWVGNCIGKRNYRYFLLYLYTTNLNVCFVIATCVAEIVLDTTRSPLYQSSQGNALKDTLDQSQYFAIIIPAYALIGLGFVGGLGGFHCWLAAKGRTTNESIKKMFFRQGNPWDMGVRRNCYSVLFPPSYISFLNHDKTSDIELEGGISPPTPPLQGLDTIDMGRGAPTQVGYEGMQAPATQSAGIVSTEDNSLRV